MFSRACPLKGHSLKTVQQNELSPFEQRNVLCRCRSTKFNASGFIPNSFKRVRNNGLVQYSLKYGTDRLVLPNIRAGISTALELIARPNAMLNVSLMLYKHHSDAFEHGMLFYINSIAIMPKTAPSQQSEPAMLKA